MTGMGRRIVTVRTGWQGGVCVKHQLCFKDRACTAAGERGRAADSRRGGACGAVRGPEGSLCWPRRSPTARHRPPQSRCSLCLPPENGCSPACRGIPAASTKSSPTLWCEVLGSRRQRAVPVLSETTWDCLRSPKAESRQWSAQLRRQLLRLENFPRPDQSAASVRGQRFGVQGMTPTSKKVYRS